MNWMEREGCLLFKVNLLVTFTCLLYLLYFKFVGEGVGICNGQFGR